MRASTTSPRRFARALATLVLASAAVGALPSAASAAFYWTVSSGFFEGSIGRTAGPGKPVQLHWIKHASGPAAITTTRRHVYWVNNDAGTIGRARIDGSHVDQAFIERVGLGAFDLTVGGGRIYWLYCCEDPDAIGSARLDGSQADNRFISFEGAAFDGYGPYAEPFGLDAYGGYLYWSNYCGVCLDEPDEGTISRANLDGTGIDLDFVESLDPKTSPSGIAVGPSGIYWHDRHTRAIWKASLDGTVVTPNLVTGLNPYNAQVEIDDRHLYWTRDAPHAISRSDLAGGNVDRRYLKTRSRPESFAVDSR